MTPELSSWTFGPAASLFFAYAFPGLTAGVSSVRSFARGAVARRRAHAVRESAEAETRALDEGDLVLRGDVEDDGAGAVRATIEQDGNEAESSGSWTVTWTERSRKTDVAPFSVRHASGQRVRVLPGRDTKLAASLVVTERTSLTTRRRIAKIAPGDDVWVTGVLRRELDREAAGPYRGGKGWVMRPPRGEPMVVATEPPDAALLKHARSGAAFGVLFALLLGVMMLAQFNYHALRLGGAPASAVVTSKWLEHDDDGVSARVLAVKVTDAHGRELEDTWKVNERSYDAAREGDSVACIASVGAATSLPLDEPRASVAATALTGIAWLVLAIVARTLSRRVAWYDGGRVVESHGGRLKDSFG